MNNTLEVLDVAHICHDANRAFCRTTGDNSLASWEDAEEAQRASIIAGVHRVVEDPSITSEQLHEAWCAFKRDDGWVYGPEKDTEKKEHPCLVPYAELPAIQKSKDVLFRAIVSALLPPAAPVVPASGNTDPIAGLTEGRIVHYVLPDGQNVGDHRPAIVVRVWNPKATNLDARGCVQLQVFTDGHNDTLANVEWRTSVMFDDSPAPAPGTWHWPERA